MNRAVIRPMSPREVALLNEAEETIAAGLTTFIEVGQALLVVRDERLYRRDFVTFEDYCVARWQISRPHAYRLMDAARVVSPMGDIEDPPTNERQVRELARVADDDRAEVWQKAVDATGGQPTAAAVRAAAEDHRGNSDPGAGFSDPAGASAGTDAPAPAATADRVSPAVASPDTANRPGPAEAGATGAGSAPAPVADTPDPGVAAPAPAESSPATAGPHGKPAVGGNAGEGDNLPSSPAPAKWTAEERKAHEEEVQVRKDIESAHAFAKTFVTEVRNQCFTILVGYRLGETHLITAEQIADCRRALDLLEKEVIADAQR